MQVASPWIPEGVRALEINCLKGEFLSYLGARKVKSVGIDLSAPEINMQNYQLYPESFDQYANFQSNSFDVIVMLTALEHMSEVQDMVFECARILRPMGRVALIVPSPLVDSLL